MSFVSTYNMSNLQTKCQRRGFQQQQSRWYTRFTPRDGTHLHLIHNNRNYRFYLLSHLCQQLGDWFVRISSLLVVNRLAPDSSSAISISILCYLLPFVLLSPVGGALADSFDRKWLILLLDALAAIVTLGYLVAIRRGDLYMLYGVTVVRATIAALYNPVSASIVPMLVAYDDLQKAGSIHGVIYSLMMVLGGFLSGYATSVIGVEACYGIDSVTYVLSGLIMSKVEGTFLPNNLQKHDDTNGREKYSYLIKDIKACLPVKRFGRMTLELFNYLNGCGFGALVIMKASGCLTWGASDVLRLSLAKVSGNEAETSRRMGMLYAAGGIGSLSGLFLANASVDSKRPSTLQRCCISAFPLLVIGWLGISNAPSFTWVCIFTSVKAIGVGIIWIYSTLILQKLTDTGLTGRVLAFELQTALSCEALVSILTGYLMDKGYSIHDITTGAAILGGILCSLWSVYHVLESGAASEKFNSEKCTPSLPSNEMVFFSIETS